MTSHVMDRSRPVAETASHAGHGSAATVAGPVAVLEEIPMSSLTSTVPMTFLRKVLWADALVSAAAGAVMAFGGTPLQALTGLPGTVLLPAGLSLFVYAAFVVWLATRAATPSAGVWAAVAINLVWAVDCLAIAFGPWFTPGAVGQAFLVAQAVTVIVFAELQVIGLRRGN